MDVFQVEVLRSIYNSGAVGTEGFTAPQTALLDGFGEFLNMHGGFDRVLHIFGSFSLPSVIFFWARTSRFFQVQISQSL